MIDLHVHTTMSDGTVTPRGVVRLAASRGMQAIAVTDHDTVAGVSEAEDEGRTLGVDVLAGVEISARWDDGILHILGYLVDCCHQGLLDALDHLQGGRRDRLPRIVSKLNHNQVPVTVDEVSREAQGGVPGRPHVAKVLLRKGIVRSLQEAFDRYLKRGAAAYVEKVKLPPGEAIRLIVEAGGVPVLAHPYSLRQDGPGGLDRTVEGLVVAGLQGIEVYYPRHTQEQTRRYIEVARRYGLLMTGGTDFHGSNKPQIQLGIIPGVEPLPYRIVEELKSRKGSPMGEQSSKA